MAKQVLKSCTFLVGSLDLSGNTNQCAFDVSAPEVDMTTFASAGWYEGLGGIAQAEFDFQGFWESVGVSGNPDAELMTRIGTIAPVTVMKANPAVAGEVAYFADGLETKYMLGAQIGDAARMNVHAKGVKPLIRGTLIETVVRTTTGLSAGQLLAAVSATQRLYVGVHVLAVAGTTPTLDLIIQSGTTSGFPSPVTRITVPQFAGGLPGFYSTSVVGPITDTWYRVSATVGGTGPSFTYVVVLGIL